MKDINYKVPHPSDVVGLHRILHWRHLEADIEYEMELVSYYSAKAHRYAKGGYIDFAAKIVADYESSNLEKDELVRISIPYKTFTNAMFALPIKMRTPTLRETLGEDNLYIKFIKRDRSHLDILIIERRANNKELKATAKELMAVKNMYFGEEDE